MIRKVDLVSQSVATIEDWIKSGKYENMSLLPSEGDLSLQMEVSRATIRDAIRILEVRGYVVRIHGVGVKVNDRSTEVAISSLSDMILRNDISFNDLLEIRKLMEPKAAELATIHATTSDLEALENCIVKMEGESSNTKVYQENDYGFHEILAKASGNQLLYTIVSSYSALLIRQIDEADSYEIELESEHHFHREIYNRIIKKDSEGAKEQMMIHLDNTERNLQKAGNLA